MTFKFAQFPNADQEFQTPEKDFNDTLNATVQGAEDNSEVYVLEGIRRWLYIILPVVIYLLGIPGNILACIVFRRHSLKKNSLSKFFIALCLNNLFCILWGVTRHFFEGVIHWNFRLHSKVVCFVHSYCLVVSMSFGNWLLVVISGCRTVYIANPERLNRTMSFTTSFSIFMGCFLTVAIPQAFIVEYGNWIKIDGSSGALLLCELSKGGFYGALSMSIFAFIPGILLVGLNTSMYWFHKVQIPESMVNRKSTKMVTNQLYLMILLTNILFIVTNVPLALYYSIYSFIFDFKTPIELARARLGLAISAMLFYVGQSMNVVLYSIFGSLFRMELKRILKPTMPLSLRDWFDVEGLSMSEFSSKAREQPTDEGGKAVSNSSA